MARIQVEEPIYIRPAERVTRLLRRRPASIVEGQGVPPNTLPFVLLIKRGPRWLHLTDSGVYKNESEYIDKSSYFSSSWW